MDASRKTLRKKSPTTAVGDPPQIPRPAAIGAAAQMLATAGMICNDILPFSPVIDNGIDTLTSAYGTCFKRVQIRGERSCRNKGRYFSFSLIRRKAKKKDADGTYRAIRYRYNPRDIDVFVFVHVVYMRFFIVPVEDIDLTKNRITLRPGDKWENAWHYLQQ